MSKRNRLSSRMKGLTGMLVSLILMSAMAVVASAQKRNDGTLATGGGARRDALLARENDLRNRELSLRLLREQAKARKPTEQDRKLVVRQIFEDFQRIQLMNNEMTRAASNSQALDYKHISDVANEISRSAKRLKTNLGIPNFEEAGKGQAQQVATNGEQVRASLLTLNHLVRSFVTNPLFQNPKVTDVGQFAKVRQDLSGIVELSHSVRRSAEKMKK